MFTHSDQNERAIPGASNPVLQNKESNNQAIEQSPPAIKIGEANDAYEKEADVMADKVMQMPEALNLTPGNNSLSRKCAECESEEKELQRKETNSDQATTSAGLENPGGGQPLPMEVRNFYEPRFGYDFGNVEIHTNAIAAKSAESVNASAYTSGNHIVFNNDQYSPQSDRGKRLLGHELTHVVQQSDNIQRKIIQRQESTEEVEQSQPEVAMDVEDLQAGISSPLQVGQVVRVEVRNGASIEQMTNNYPVSPNGCINLPMVGCIMAKGKSTTKLRADIEQALKGGFLKSPTVNVSSVNKTVDYSHGVQPGESVYLRVLGSAGDVEFDGDFPVDSNGQIHVPMVGDMTVQGKSFATIEAEVKTGLLNGFLKSPTVHAADKKI